MKVSHLFIAIILLISVPSMAQKGINFIKTGNFNTAVATAKQQNKLLFMEVYAPDCHICNAFKGTFAQPQVGALYNAKFVNFQLDIRNPENQKLLKKLKITINATPTFIFMDPTSLQIVGAKIFGERDNSVINVNSIAQKAINPAEHALNYAKRLKAGDKNPQFLLNYAEYARIVGDTTSNIAAFNEFAKTLNPSQYTSQSTFNAIQMVMMNNNNVLFDYFINHIPAYERIYEANPVRMSYENIFQIVLTSSQANKLSVADIQKIKAQMAKAGLDPGSIQRRMWMVESSLLFKQKKGTQAIQVIEKLLAVLPNAPGPKEYQYLCDYVNGKTKDKKALAYAKTHWCKFGMK
ncbi:DUF255 domain-containing protein [Aquirufa ecclesiirivi]|uniref:thioredoxin family protein n=1 Tax=Aquirufa ecclesiirivi TaxID=2715124 RepID=UPI0022A87278|nr:thioredoxin family protein [Aquirufa ecclesiirivi]MCZ2472013.1 DUF255 domain-containing protein [Aquirufa ecclesiirivi]